MRAECPLCSESDRLPSRCKSFAKCHLLPDAPQQTVRYSIASLGASRGNRGTGVTKYWIGAAASVQLDVGRPDHLAPFFNFPRNERFEFVGGVCDCCCTQIGHSRFDVGVRKSCIRFFVKLVNSFDRCVLGNADTIPATRLIAGYKFVQRWHVRERWPA